MSQKPTYKELEQHLKLWQEQAFESKDESTRVRQSQVELALILSNMPLFMMVVGSDRRVKTVSKSILQYTGRTEQEVLGLRGGEALRCAHHIDDPQGCGFGDSCATCAVRLTVGDTLKTGRSHHQVESKLTIIREQVEEKILLVSTAMIEHPEPRVLVFIEDVTEKRAADEQLKEKEALLKRLGDNLPQGAVYRMIHQRDGHRYFEYAGAGFQRLFGLMPADLMKDAGPLYALASPQDAQATLEAETQAAQTLSEYHFEGRMVLPDGQTRWYQWHSIPSRREDGALVWDGVCLDIQDRKQVEEEREKLIDQLQTALAEVKVLRGILPICSFCKKIRTDDGYWEQMETYLHKYSGASFSHGICPKCAKEHFPEVDLTK